MYGRVSPAVSMKYRTIVADPPWQYDEGWPGWNGVGPRKPLPYPSMAEAEITALPVRDWIASEGYLFLWATNRHLEAAHRVVRAWGCNPTTVLTWCKAPMGVGPGGMFSITTEFIIVAQRINPGTHAHGKRTNGERIPTTWFEWPRGEHSRKPDAFLDLVERVSPGPYLEMFARRGRLGWDAWGDEAPVTLQPSLGLPATPFQRVVDDLTEGCGCACHIGIGYNAACRHCQPRPYPSVRHAMHQHDTDAGPGDRAEHARLQEPER